MGAGGGDEFHHRRRDDAERAFGPDEKVAQVVAGIVLVQFGHEVEHAAIGQHHLEPQTERAGGAVAQDVRAARVGGKHAADHGRTARAEPEREVEALGFRRFVQAREDDARFDHGKA